MGWSKKRGERERQRDIHLERERERERERMCMVVQWDPFACTFGRDWVEDVQIQVSLHLLLPSDGPPENVKKMWSFFFPTSQQTLWVRKCFPFSIVLHIFVYNLKLKTDIFSKGPISFFKESFRCSAQKFDSVVILNEMWKSRN